MKTGQELIREISETGPAHGNAVFWWLGQHSYIVRTEKRTIYLDPYLSENSSRMVAPPLRPEQVVNADIVTGSHDHIDHIDRNALPAMMKSSPECRLIVPKITVESLKDSIDVSRITGLDDGEVYESDGLKITALKAAHEFFDRDDAMGYPYLGFVIETDGVTIYHSGDTCMYDGLAATLQKWNLTAAFLPINGRDAVRLRANCIGNMTYQEAVDLAGSIRPGLSIPGHYGMFSSNTVDPALFVDYMNVKYPDLKCALPRLGEPVVI